MIIPLMAQLMPGAAEILTEGRQASEAASQGFDQLFQDVLQGALFAQMTNVGVLLAVLALGLFLVQWAPRLMNGDEVKAIPELVWPLVVIVFLNNQGALLSTSVLELRNVVNQVNLEILDGTVAGASLKESYQESRIGTAINDTLTANIQECIDTRPQRQQPACIATARSQAEALRQQSGLGGQDSGFFEATLQSVVQLAVRNILSALHGSFQWLIEIVLLVTSLLAPIALGLSLLPTPARPIIAWISGFFTVALIKINFNLISGLAAYASNLSGISVNSLLLPVLLGLGAPILSVLIGLQGGSAMFNALATVATFTTYQFAARGLGKAGRGAWKVLRSTRKRFY